MMMQWHSSNDDAATQCRVQEYMFRTMMSPRVHVLHYDVTKSNCSAIWWAQEYMFRTMMGPRVHVLHYDVPRVHVSHYDELKSNCFAICWAEEYMFRSMMCPRVHVSHYDEFKSTFFAFWIRKYDETEKKGTNLLCNLLSVYWVNCLVVWFNIFVISALGGPDGEYIGFSEYSPKGPGWTIMPPADEGNRLDA